jgi:uncharacterized iron-regulated membrane protein
MMSLTGSLIIFRGDIERLTSPKPLSANFEAPAGTSKWTSVEMQVASLNPEAHITRLNIPGDVRDPLSIQVETKDKRRMEILADPSSGRFLGLKTKLAWLEFLVDLHQKLLFGKTGRALTGVIGIAMLFLSASGLVSWLAGRRHWKSALSVPKRGPWRRVNYELHKWGGLWSNCFLLVVAFTGIALAYPDFAELVMGEAKPAKLARKESPQLLSLSEYLGAAEASVRGGVVRELRMPSGSRSAVTVVLWTPSDIRPKGGNTVSLDPATGKVISIERSADWPASKQFMEFANAIHKVEWGGWIKVPWVLLGLAPVFLFVSGIQIWWHQRKAALRTPAGAQLARETESVSISS